MGFVCLSVEFVFCGWGFTQRTHPCAQPIPAPPQDCDDDGEDAAGGRLLHLLQVTNACNVCVVVTRWYGGVLLGPSRFALINNTARHLLEQEGFIGGKGGGESGKGERKRG